MSEYQRRMLARLRELGWADAPALKIVRSEYVYRCTMQRLSASAAAEDLNRVRPGGKGA